MTEGASGVEDVFDDDHISTFDAAVNIFLDLDDTGAADFAVPTADLHEFELAFAAEFPQGAGKVAEEVDRAFEDSEQDDRGMKEGCWRRSVQRAGAFSP